LLLLVVLVLVVLLPLLAACCCVLLVLVRSYFAGLLSAYALTKDELYKEKALDIGTRLAKAFNTKTGVPYGVINLKVGGGCGDRSAGLALVRLWRRRGWSRFAGRLSVCHCL